MTVKEANQQISDCEDQIKKAYSDFLREAREVSSKGMDPVMKQKNDAVNAADSVYGMKMLAAIVTVIIGLVMMFASHPGWGIILIISGGVAIYNVTKSSSTMVDEKVAAANRNVDEVSGKQSGLNAVLDKNKYV
ncbi:hypothetical protein [Butyrivibrio sp.]|uniref:hypothetical protein n=1 Tax=Butyrivibrio sp. TaxID=28121 RepID=UPI0025C3A90F|nr:hypothetical protein [Butyrivibrio sp.]MBE5838438.1 hypothetical protein [Butyrivibrio sp.]